MCIFSDLTGFKPLDDESNAILEEEYLNKVNNCSRGKYYIRIQDIKFEVILYDDQDKPCYVTSMKQNLCFRVQRRIVLSSLYNLQGHLSPTNA